MRTPNGDIIVLIPGIMGSTLFRDGQQVWGKKRIVRSIAQRNRTMVDELVLSSAAFQNERTVFDDGVRADSLISSAIAFPPPKYTPRVPEYALDFLPGFWTIVDGYEVLVHRLQRHFDARDLCLFPYDWRQSNRVSAWRLKETVEPLIHARRKTDPSAQIIFVAHSMGGVIARYYAECLDTEGITDRVISIGTPFQGSLKALIAMANDTLELSIGPIPLRIGIRELLQSFPSVAELLPAYPCVGVNQSNLEEITSQNCPQLPIQIVKHHKLFHREIETAIQKNSRKVKYIPIVSHRQTTPYWARKNGLVFEPQSPSDLHLRGDGTVSRISAVPSEYEDRGSGYFVNGRHGGLQHSEPVWEQVFGEITGSAIRKPMSRKEILDVEADEYTIPGNDWEIRARTIDGNTDLSLSIEITDSQGVSHRSRMAFAEDRYTATLKFDRPGIFRWKIASDGYGDVAVHPLSDLIASIQA